MKYNPLWLFLAVVLLLLLLTAGSVALAQTSAGFNLEWHVIGSGGGESSSASYQVNGTMGQSIASQTRPASANFIVSGGYWFANTGPSGTIGTHRIYLPVVVKN